MEQELKDKETEELLHTPPQEEELQTLEGEVILSSTELVSAQVMVEELNEVQEPEKKGSKWKAVLREHFSATRIAYMAIFTALAYAVCWLEFSIFPAAGFLKLDFANVFFLFEGFIFGPVEAFVSIVIKELLCFGTKSSTGGVGEVANLIMSTAYIIVPSVAYRFKRGKWWVCLYLACGCVMQMGLSLIVNRYINFRIFMGETVGAMQFAKLWYYVLAFNAIKSVVISVVVFLIYKPLSRFIKMTTEKFDKRMARAKGKKKQED